jgi:hypothetical protein
MDTENRHPKTASALNLRSHSIDKLNHYDRRIKSGRRGSPTGRHIASTSRRRTRASRGGGLGHRNHDGHLLLPSPAGVLLSLYL